jgi:hypothetical protein
MTVTTVLQKVPASEQVRIDEFFTRLSTPVDPATTHAKAKGEVFSPFYIIAWITVGTGLLLMIASFVQPGGVGRNINLGAGAALWILAFGLYRLHVRFVKRESSSEPTSTVAKGSSPTLATE